MNIVYSRRAPSEAYKRLLRIYAGMHADGYLRVKNGMSEHKAAADTFVGEQTGRYVREIRDVLSACEGLSYKN